MRLAASIAIAYLTWLVGGGLGAPLEMPEDRVLSPYTGYTRTRWIEATGQLIGEVITHTLIGDDGEVHVFWHTSARPAYLMIGGYGISLPPGGKLIREQSETGLLLRGGSYRSAIEVAEAPPGELLFELLEPRSGWRHSHLFGGRGAYPYWRSREPVPPHRPVVVYVNGVRGREAVTPPVTVSLDRGALHVTVEGGRREIQLPR